MFLTKFQKNCSKFQNYDLSWLVGCFWFNGPLRQYFRQYRAVCQREGETGERIEESKNIQITPLAPTASAIGPCPTVIQIVGRPGTGSLPSTIAPPDHHHDLRRFHELQNIRNFCPPENKVYLN